MSTYGDGVGFRPVNNLHKWSFGRQQLVRETEGDLSLIDQIPAADKVGGNYHRYRMSAEGRQVHAKLFGLEDLLGGPAHWLVNVKSRWYPYRDFHATRDMLTFFSNAGYDHRPPLLSGIRAGGTASWFECMLLQAFGGPEIGRLFTLWQEFRDTKTPEKPSEKPVDPVDLQELRDAQRLEFHELHEKLDRILEKLGA